MRGGKTTPLKKFVQIVSMKRKKVERLRNPQQNEPLGRVIEVKLRLFGNA